MGKDADATQPPHVGFDMHRIDALLIFIYFEHLGQSICGGLKNGFLQFVFRNNILVLNIQSKIFNHLAGLTFLAASLPDHKKAAAPPWHRDADLRIRLHRSVTGCLPLVSDESTKASPTVCFSPKLQRAMQT